jgi:hypothetical protein
MNDEHQEEFWTGGEVFTYDAATGTGTTACSPKKIVEKSAGCTCTKCGDFYEYAEPNREDGTFKCWGCRH